MQEISHNNNNNNNQYAGNITQNLLHLQTGKNLLFVILMIHIQKMRQSHLSVLVLCSFFIYGSHYDQLFLDILQM